MQPGGTTPPGCFLLRALCNLYEVVMAGHDASPQSRLAALRRHCGVSKMQAAPQLVGAGASRADGV
jgi:hypothetical protein